MRSHEEFCAELERRKVNLIRRKKARQRMLMTGASFVICFGLLTAVGNFGKPSDIDSESTEESYVSSAPTLLSVQLPLKGELWDENSDLSTLSDGMLEISNTEDAERLLSFIEVNPEAFLYSDSDNGWYTYSRCIYETEKSDTPSDTMTPEDELWETEECLEAWTEEDHDEGTSTPDFGKSHDQTGFPTDETERTSTTSPIRDQTTESASGESLSPAFIYLFSSAELSDSVESIDNVYVISVKKEDGSTVCYALDAIAHSELADILYDLLNTIVSIP